MPNMFQFLSQSEDASSETHDRVASRGSDRLMQASVIGPFMALALLGDVVLMELARRRVQPQDIPTQTVERPKIKKSVPAEQVAEALRVQYVGDGRVIVASTDTVAIAGLRTRLQREPGQRVRLELSSDQQDYISLINALDGADVLIPLDTDGPKPSPQ